MRRLIWSDLHLGHTKVIGYENRPFADVEEMDRALIEAWRTNVKRDDVLFNLGDVMWQKSKTRLQNLLHNLPGKKVLIMGNHDRDRPVTWWKDAGFDEVYPYPIIVDNFWIFSHEPVYLNANMPYVNLHGHTHGNSMGGENYVNVSVEKIAYRPVDFDKIKATIMENK